MRRSNLVITAGLLAGTAALCLPPSVAGSGDAPRTFAKPAPAASLAMVPLVDDSVALTRGVMTTPKAGGSTTAVYPTGTSISPTGDVALISDGGAHSVLVVAHPRTRPTTTTLGLWQFKGEGGPQYRWFPSGVSFVGNAQHAVVAGNGQGLVQLIRTSRGWAVDLRVHSSGTNAAGVAHKRGLIAIPDSSSAATLYDGIAVSPTSGSAGTYLGVTIDRTEGTLAVVSGLGSAHPRVESTLVSAEIENAAGEDDGNGGVAFSPAGPARVAVTTATGVGVLDLSDPAHPSLQSLTVTPTPPQSVAVAPDGDHVLVGAGNHVFLYRGLLTAGAASPLSLVKGVPTPDPSSASPEVSAIGYLPTGAAVVVHGDSVHGYGRQTLLRHAGSTSASWGPTRALRTGPNVDNALSVWPRVAPALTAPHVHKVMKRGQKVVSKLRVSPGGVRYSFRLSAGRLPHGLHLRGDRISGRLTRTGHFSCTLRATSAYGAVLTRHVVMVVERRR